MQVPKVITEIAQKIEAADGVIIATLNMTILSRCFMNILAWLSYGIYPMVNKPVMIVGTSP